MNIDIEFNASAFKHGITEEELNKLDDELTESTPTFTSGKQGIFARQKDMVVILDGFTSRYLTSKMLKTKKNPTELIHEMVQNEIKAVVG